MFAELVEANTRGVHAVMLKINERLGSSHSNLPLSGLTNHCTWVGFNLIAIEPSYAR